MSPPLEEASLDTRLELVALICATIEKEIVEIKRWIKENNDEWKCERRELEARVRRLEEAQNQCKGREMTHAKFIAILTAIFIFAQVVGAFLPFLIRRI